MTELNRVTFETLQTNQLAPLRRFTSYLLRSLASCEGCRGRSGDYHRRSQTSQFSLNHPLTRLDDYIIYSSLL